MLRIPITMCHGISENTGDGSPQEYPLSQAHLRELMKIAADMGFQTINYDHLAAWREGTGELPPKPLMFDVDHPVKGVLGIHEVLASYGFAGTLFINTAPMRPDFTGEWTVECMSWEEIRELIAAGWHIGAHTDTHPNLSELFKKDPDGQLLEQELNTCDRVIEENLGIRPVDFAFTGTSWSSAAEAKVMQRYRFGRLWIVGTHYQVDGEETRYAELAGVAGEDEPDGGPPMAARYITRDTPAYRLPSMELQRPLVHSPEAFRRYLEAAE